MGEGRRVAADPKTREEKSDRDFKSFKKNCTNYWCDLEFYLLVPKVEMKFGCIWGDTDRERAVNEKAAH